MVVADAVWLLVNGIPSRLSSSFSLLWEIGQSVLGKYANFKAIVLIFREEVAWQDEFIYVVEAPNV